MAQLRCRCLPLVTWSIVWTTCNWIFVLFYSILKYWSDTMTTSPFPFFGQNNERTIGDQWSMTQANGMITKLTGKNWFCSITLHIFFYLKFSTCFFWLFGFSYWKTVFILTIKFPRDRNQVESQTVKAVPFQIIMKKKSDKTNVGLHTYRSD